MRASTLSLLFLAAALGGNGPAEVATSRAVNPGGGPQTVLWAWERPEDLRFLGARDIAVAYLAGTLHLRDDEVVVSPRRQPLRVHPWTYRIAVIRIESPAGPAGVQATALPMRPTLQPAQRAEIVRRVADLTVGQGAREVQIDFDARASQREAYVHLLREIRRSLPASVRLTMTALASWCSFDRWLDQVDLPVDEVVPMVFGMGRGGREVIDRLAVDGDFRSPQCRRAVGLSLEEDSPTFPSKRRAYWFHNGPWDEDALSLSARRRPR